MQSNQGTYYTPSLSLCYCPCLVEYVVSVFHLAKREKEPRKIFCLDRKTDWQKEISEKKKGEYGVLVCMIDYKIGMFAEDILAIADVGTSYERNEKRR